jgi:hypothetical protein
MVLQYFKGIDLSTALDSSPIEARVKQCFTEARWNYCESNGLVGGYRTKDSEVTGSDRMIKVLNYEGLQTKLVTGSSVTIQRIEQAINLGSLVICHVSPEEYYTQSSVNSHWALAYGYDDESIIIHDPGYINLAGYHVPRATFTTALQMANGGNDMILIIVSNVSPPSAG